MDSIAHHEAAALRVGKDAAEASCAIAGCQQTSAVNGSGYQFTRFSIPKRPSWFRKFLLRAQPYGISGLIAFAGLTVGGTVAYMSDSAIAWLRHWLKIS
ncbi:hypothetical protein NXC14_CH00810 [Rhizobium sp. NXC14]|uniref:hypothetical protein n=1 Tax=Rhizobium sp. NXC14 TaxID=1981173 RepID=UPI000A2069B7|nr:hypothetical protein [Rhizobium sp. NXC14]ARO28807.1 hypothetical protein NXC14_CH00810 [Rhizobium sp. NXC14]